MELGVTELSPKYFLHKSTSNGKEYNQPISLAFDQICKNFILMKFNGVNPDRFMKERLSFIELAFRERESQIYQINKNFDKTIAKEKLIDLQPIFGNSNPSKDTLSTIEILRDSINSNFKNAVNELNERLKRANYKLHYHNGFIQISEDELIASQIEDAFWALTAQSDWKNVDIDMKEAIDLRDNGGADPAFYAARALESTIKIISQKKGWTQGTEKGAHSYIDNLASKKNGCYIKDWERDSLKYFFTKVRNPFGHGAGGGERPKLSSEQTSWAIENCMSWIKTLITRA